jgi:UDPglucose 6-dehydrogenase
MVIVKAKIGAKIQYATNKYNSLKKADALIITTEWSEFRTPDFELMLKLLKYKVVFNRRILFNSNKIKALSYKYKTVGLKIYNYENNFS